MSYFETLVLVKKDDFITGEAIFRRVGELLAPYDESNEVEPFEVECGCKGLLAKLKSVEIVEKATGTKFNDLRMVFSRIPDAYRPSWKDFASEFNWLVRRVEVQHPLFEAFNPDCQLCNGSGFYLETKNPNARWDHWEVGGCLSESMDIVSGQYFFKSEILRKNIVLTNDLIDQPYIPFAIVSYEGWFEKGRMGLWTQVQNVKPDEVWEAEVNQLIHDHLDHWAIRCKLHI
ncbi:hypothetical protein SAMN05444392_11153 [Seinonella peptonophila]|uniref:Uncharacterized protein n=1 Tax=Seinonella peptonophila TaxID=112248 RepID=A0A1M4ZYU8_9BACL|nr:hypothetical protein [Seinonella peptonophila]SHF23155.1 hypothetical protein SAMN05444392_11153 [Seinonella peptonophila]